MKRIPLLYSLKPVIAAALVITGCATVMDIITDPVPADESFLLASDPQRSGLLIVSVDVFLDPSYDVFRDNLVEEGLSALFGTSKRTGFIRGLKVTDESGREFSSRLLNPGTIIFDGLPQGVYRLSAASAVFTLDNSERKEYFDCEYIVEEAPIGYQGQQDWSNSNCPYRADVSFSLEDRADSAVGPIHVTNGQVMYVGLLTIVENHRLSDYRIERIKINDRWQEVLDHGHSIKHVIKSDPRPHSEEMAVHWLATDNPGSGWQAILQEHGRSLSE